MNHIRQRYALVTLKEKLKFSPVVLVQGARQTGKSFLVNKLLPASGVKIDYKTLDLAAVKDFAESNTDSFVSQKNDGTVFIIDEAQKVPALFNSVKASVDNYKKPGQFILLGSTEFSKLTNIKESLTGRASKIKVFPMLLSEIKHLPINKTPDYLNSKPRVSRNDFLKFLENGGMPGYFGIKNEQIRFESYADWLSLTCERDALLFKNLKIDSDLLKKILTQIAQLEEPSFSMIVKALKVDARKIKTHLSILKTLFVINEVKPITGSTGKSFYYFFDVGFLNNYNSSFEKKIKTTILQELTALMNYRNEYKREIVFYRTAKGSMIDFIVQENEVVQSCFKVYAEDRIHVKNTNLLESFKAKFKAKLAKNVRLNILCGTLEKMKLDDVSIFPWESLV
jgi:predicted AAA+ superfamily ATPase